MGCSTIDVNVDYDESFKFSEVNDYTIEHKAKEGESTLVNDRITAAIEEQLNQRGYKKNADAKELVFHFYYASKEKTDFQTSYGLGGGYGRIGWGSGLMVSTTNTYDYTEGTLVIDATNVKTNKIVWRGVGTLELKEQKTPEDKRKYVNKIVAKILEKFPSKIVKE